jgi:hypothetical protein
MNQAVRRGDVFWANLVGMERVAILLSLYRYGVAMIDVDTEELESDSKNA